ncbi:hypothetical protein RQP46_005865 [Phenoliferia psychrophenolica]
MSNNAYTLEPPNENWWDVDKKWNVSDSFGWLDDGMRGHIFADDKNETIIVAIKGTSQDCIEEAVMSSTTYYTTAVDLYNNISALYPHSQIWLTGHSLGGALAALLSYTYGVPSVSFESPADRLPAQRLHLPLPPSPRKDDLATHVYHTADPIAMGTCNGAYSSCALGGFAFETRCHTGKSIVYDTVGRLGWSVSIQTHSIQWIIQYLLLS